MFGDPLATRTRSTPTTRSRRTARSGSPAPCSGPMTSPARRRTCSCQRFLHAGPRRPRRRRHERLGLPALGVSSSRTFRPAGGRASPRSAGRTSGSTATSRCPWSRTSSGTTSASRTPAVSRARPPACRRRWVTRARSTGRLRRCRSTPIRSTRWATARAAADEHGAQAGARAAAASRCPDGRRLGHVPARSHGDARPGPWSCSASRSPAAASYFVEYRRPIGVFDFQAPAVTGVLIHTESPDLVDPNPSYHGDSDTALIDMHPTGGFPSNQWTDAAMSVGQIFDDPVRGISIQNVAQSAERCHAGHHDAGRHDAAQPSGQAHGGRQRHERRAAMDARRQTISRSLPTPSRATAPCSARRRRTTLRRQRPDARSHGQLRRDRHRRGRQRRPGRDDGRHAAGHVGAERARERHRDREPGRPACTSPGRPRPTTSASSRYRVLRDGTGIAQPTAHDVRRHGTRGRAAARRSSYSVVAFDQVGNASPPGAAPPLRAALLRQLGASHLKVKRAKKSTLVQVTGTLSDVKAICRLRLGRGAWHRCKVKPSSAFARQRARQAREAGDALAARRARPREAADASRTLGP